MKKCLIVIMLSVPIFLLAQEFKSLSAKAAQQEYLAAISKVKSDYIKKLEASLELAYKTKNLDEAKLIIDEINKLKDSDDTTVLESKPKEKKSTLVIISAKWGADRRIIDVTEFIQNLIKDDAIDTTVGGYPDAAQGAVKTLTIEYSIKGVKKTFTGIEGEFLRLNVPPKKK